MAAFLAMSSVPVPPDAEAATRRTASKRTSKQTAAQRRAAERRKRAAARRAAARRRAAELARQRRALQKVWQPEKGCYQSGSVFTEPGIKDDDPIEVPEDARGGSMKAALLMYEANVDKNGRLHSLRTLRPLPKDPPWPQLHEAVVTSVTGWRWERTKVAGKTIPVCFPLTLNLDLR
jgi:hypothetical protein